MLNNDVDSRGGVDMRICLDSIDSHLSDNASLFRLALLMVGFQALSRNYKYLMYILEFDMYVQQLQMFNVYFRVRH